jgi:hypothetical protein
MKQLTMKKRSEIQNSHTQPGKDIEIEREREKQ